MIYLLSFMVIFQVATVAFQTPGAPTCHGGPLCQEAALEAMKDASEKVQTPLGMGGQCPLE